MMGMRLEQRMEQQQTPRRRIKRRVKISPQGNDLVLSPDAELFMFRDFGNHLELCHLFTPKRSANRYLDWFRDPREIPDIIHKYYKSRSKEHSQDTIIIAAVYDSGLRHYQTYEVQINVSSS